MHDCRAAASGLGDVVRIRRVAEPPVDVGRAVARRRRARERPHAPARAAQRPNHFAADSACRAYHERHIQIRHRLLPNVIDRRILHRAPLD